MKEVEHLECFQVSRGENDALLSVFLSGSHHTTVKPETLQAGWLLGSNTLFEAALVLEKSPPCVLQCAVWGRRSTPRHTPHSEHTQCCSTGEIHCEERHHHPTTQLTQPRDVCPRGPLLEIIFLARIRHGPCEFEGSLYLNGFVC